MLKTTATALLLAFSALPAWADAPVLRLIVDRGPKAVEIFANMPADRLLSLLNTDPQGLAAEDGRVYYGALRETGTFDFGDTMVADVTLEVAGRATVLEAMSVMVHPHDNGLDFATPIDGAIAMSVCLVPDPDVPPTMDELVLYSGFIAYPEDGYAPISLALPNDAPVEVEVITYAGGGFVGQDSYTLPAGGVVSLPGVTPVDPSWFAAMVRWVRGT